MARIVNAGGAAFSALGGFAGGFTKGRADQQKMALAQQKMALAERQVALDEAFQKGKAEERQQLMDQSAAQVEMDYLESEGLGNKRQIQGRGAQQIGMAAAGQVLGGIPAGPQITPAVQKMQADVARWNEAFKGMAPGPRRELLNDMAQVKDQQIRVKGLKKAKAAILDDIQNTRRTEGVLDFVDDGLEALRKEIGEVDLNSPTGEDELGKYFEAYQGLLAEDKEKKGHLALRDRINKWLETQNDPMNVGAKLATDAALGQIENFNEFFGQFMAANQPGAYHATKDDVIRKEARARRDAKLESDQRRWTAATAAGVEAANLVETPGTPEWTTRMETTRRALFSSPTDPQNVPRRTQQPTGPSPEVLDYAQRAKALGLTPEETRAAFGAKISPEDAAAKKKGQDEPPKVETKADPAKIEGVESQEQYEGVLVAMVRAAKNQVQGAARSAITPAAMAVALGTGVKDWAGKQYPLVLQDIAKAAKEAGLKGVTVERLRKAAGAVAGASDVRRGLLNTALQSVGILAPSVK